MGSLRRLRDEVQAGRSDRSIRFADLRRLLLKLGFVERISGGHHIFARKGVVEIINLQRLPGGMAKAYQVKQVRQLLARYNLSLPE